MQAVSGWAPVFQALKCLHIRLLSGKENRTESVSRILGELNQVMQLESCCAGSSDTFVVGPVPPVTVALLIRPAPGGHKHWWLQETFPSPVTP